MSFTWPSLLNVFGIQKNCLTTFELPVCITNILQFILSGKDCCLQKAQECCILGLPCCTLGLLHLDNLCEQTVYSSCQTLRNLEKLCCYDGRWKPYCALYRKTKIASGETTYQCSPFSSDKYGDSQRQRDQASGLTDDYSDNDATSDNSSEASGYGRYATDDSRFDDSDFNSVQPKNNQRNYDYYGNKLALKNKDKIRTVNSFYGTKRNWGQGGKWNAYAWFIKFIMIQSLHISEWTPAPAKTSMMSL